MSDQPVLCQRDGHRVLVTLNRPEQRNALDQSIIDGLHAIMDDLWDDPEVGALILTGAGDKAFAAGADIGQLRERRRVEALMAINSRMFQRMEEAPFPTIAAIQGWCLGGGCELAMACDIRIAGEGARFGQPEVGLGIIPGAGATYRLPLLVGTGKAKELIFSGRIIDAAEAKTLGLVNEVVPDAEILDAAERMASDILKQDRLAVRLAKSLMRLDGGHRPGVGLLVEPIVQGILFESEEKMRRMGEFLERRNKKKDKR